MDCDEFEGLVARVEALECGAPSGPHLQTSDRDAEFLMERVHHLLERVADLVGEGPRAARGAGVDLPPIVNSNP